MLLYNKKAIGVVFAVAVSLQSLPARAQIIDPMIEGAKLCTKHLQRYETLHGIPAHLLSAIASTESGRYHEGLKIKLPWPWTINAEGRGHYYDSKNEAIAAAHRFIASGVNSIDIGCMQVNIHHHPNAFSSIAQGFEPENNVAYAASFLRSLYQDAGSWKKAASDYHSKTDYRGNRYVGLVYGSWVKILDKLRTARLSVPESSISGVKEMQQAGLPVTPIPNPSIPREQAPAVAVPKYIKVGSEESKAIAAYKTPISKTIKVSSSGETRSSDYKREKNNGVMVMRPKITVVDGGNRIDENNRPPEPMLMADAHIVTPNAVKQSMTDIAPSVGGKVEPNAKIIRIDNKLIDRKPTNGEISRKSGPNFIFND